jgi:hypothetical protein
MTPKTVTEITVRYWNISRLVPYERNWADWDENI